MPATVLVRNAKFFFALLILSGPLAWALDTSDYAVQVSATVQEVPPQITLSWPAPSDATGYTVYRKAVSATSWGTGTSTGTATSYVDTNVAVGTKYEYQIVKTGSGATGYGYICAGIKIPLVESRGKVILIVENTYATDLASELTRLQKDLIGDGWDVIRHDVSRNDSVTSVKTLIKNDYLADTANVKAVFLFGRVPVPYSGNTAYDGHSNHVGAWPSDTFYGELDGTWTDTSVNNTTADRPENDNIPGDGKYDQSSIPSDMELQVGRVDLYNMPAFAPKTELDLLRQYLDKDHNFRHGIVTAERRGMIDDNFGTFSGEAFAASGWRNFAPFFGASNVSAQDWFGTLPTQSYLWAYGCGGGWYQGASGVGDTSQFASSDPKAVFTMLFGSYHGDWDVNDSFLRAPLATTTMGLTCSWAGRPHWFYHHMALGENIGYSARLTQNSNYFYQGANFGTRGTHVNLMGDPTLRMHVVAPPSGFLAIDGAPINLSWTASTDSVIGYHIYRATNSTGPFTRITSSLVTGTSYSDTTAAAGTNYTYMLRAVTLETSGSGTYYNASQGIFATVTPPPTAAPDAPTSLSATAVSAFKVNLSWTDNANNESSFKIERKTGASGTWALLTSVGGDTTVYSDTTCSPGTTYFYRVRASNIIGDSANSNEAGATTHDGIGDGAGTGLTAQYFDNIDFTALTLTRVDPMVNFDFGNGAPDASMGVDSFSIRWTGQVQPKFTETYTFYTTADDGVRLWVNNQLLVDNWVDQAPTERSGTIALVAGQRYDIKMEYYENGGGAVAKLAWSSASEPKAYIPQKQLYPLGAPQNQAPVVNAGPDQNITLPASAALSGSGSDDGQPSAAVTYSWTVVSGPGNVTFGDASSLATNATFSAAGTYVLRLTGDDHLLSSSDDVTITVAADPVPPNSSPSITSPASASPTIVAIGDLVSFAVGASDSDGDTLTYSWNFGDGSPESPTPSHVYTAAGNYVATVTISDGRGGTMTSSVNITVLGSSSGGATVPIDTDGDGIPDDTDTDDDNDGVSDTNEILAGTDSLNASSFNKTPMTVSKLKGVAKFTLTQHDSCGVAGVLPDLPAHFDPVDVTVGLNIGGALRTYKLDGKGRARTPTGTFRLKLKGKRDKVTKKIDFVGGAAPYKATLLQGSWTSAWADEGVDPNASAKKKPVTFVVDLQANGKVYSASAATQYSSTAGKIGVFKSVIPRR